MFAETVATGGDPGGQRDQMTPTFGSGVYCTILTPLSGEMVVHDNIFAVWIVHVWNRLPPHVVAVYEVRTFFVQAVNSEYRVFRSLTVVLLARLMT